MIKQLLDDGKSLYKTKLKNYTLRNVLQQVRKEQGDVVPPVAGKPG